MNDRAAATVVLGLGLCAIGADRGWLLTAAGLLVLALGALLFAFGRSG